MSDVKQYKAKNKDYEGEPCSEMCRQKTQAKTTIHLSTGCGRQTEPRTTVISAIEPSRSTGDAIIADIVDYLFVIFALCTDDFCQALTLSDW
mmetsp:Transcript_20705/g.29087  ORF Transcript_20705/g.29087 Transcript_20705/m.29087 type:complete len:92 (+) Transcript_20705:177-452(+)